MEGISHLEPAVLKSPFNTTLFRSSRRIEAPNIDFKAEVKICMSSHSSTFFKASTYLSKLVERLYPPANPSSGCFRKRSSYTAVRGDRGGRRGGRGRGEHIQGDFVGGSGAHENGIDISYVTRYFED